jgi:hypothetical protein
MITIAFLTGLISSLLIYPAVIALGSWLAAHLLRAAIIKVSKIKREARTPFRISYWLMLTSLVLATIAWLFWIPFAFMMFSDHPAVLVALSITVYLAPLAIPYAIWRRPGGWTRIANLAFALIYFCFCALTAFPVGLGFFLLPAAAVLIVASVLRAYSPIPPVSGRPNTLQD